MEYLSDDTGKLALRFNFESDILRKAPYQLHFEDWDVERHEIYAALYSGHLFIADTSL